MKKEHKEAWIDRANKILAFHEIENSTRVEKTEDEFWPWAMEVIRSGYRIM